LTIAFSVVKISPTDRSVREIVMEHNSPKNGPQKMLEFAEMLFTEQGFSAVSIREIAECCEVTNAALYYHFPSKAALFEEELERYAKRLDDRMRVAGHEGETYRDRVKAMLLEYAKITMDRRPLFHLLRQENDVMDKFAKIDYFRRTFHAMILPIEELLFEAIKAEELKELQEGFSSAAVLVGMVNDQIQYSRVCGKDSLGSQELDDIVDMFWEVLGAKNDGRSD
jgi:AcrR family transcriptional regulator